MSWLKNEAEAALSVLRDCKCKFDPEVRCFSCDVAIVESVARAFAERAVRHVSESGPWGELGSVSEAWFCALFGQQVSGERAECEAWLNERIAEVLAAAEKYEP